MKDVITTQDIYHAVEELILLLKEQGDTKVPSILEHLMYKISWASASELHEELGNVLCDAISNSYVTHEIEEQMKRVVAVIKNESGV